MGCRGMEESDVREALQRPRHRMRGGGRASAHPTTPGSAPARGVDAAPRKSGAWRTVSRGGARRAVAYLSERDPGRGPATLIMQKAAVDAAARLLGCGVDRYYCDSGGPDGLERFGFALRELVLDARSDAFDTVLVESIARFSGDPDDAASAVVELRWTGVTLLAASGTPFRSSAATRAEALGRPGSRLP